MGINAKAAVAIINDYNAGEFEESIPIPEDEAELIEKATYLYTEAKKAFEAGDRDNAIQLIVWQGDGAMMEGTYPRRSSGGLSESDERETENAPVKISDPDTLAVRENLPVPAHIEADADPMPRDLTALDDKRVRKLSGEYNAYLSRVTYLLGIELGDLKRAEHLLEAARGSALRAAKVIDPKTEKPKLAKVIEAELLADKEVAVLTEAVVKHEATVDMLKALQSIYSGNVSLLSREWTMRQNEWEKGR